MKHQTGNSWGKPGQSTVRYSFLTFASTLILLVFGTIGCKTTDPSKPLTEASVEQMVPNTIRLNPGDVIQINFPGAQGMNLSERIRLDGHISLNLIGDVEAAGKTPTELQNDLMRLYKDKLQINELSVIVASTSASIFVSGAVARPGRISLERPLSVLDAIMEAGGFDPRRANVKKVTVIRQKNGKYTRHFLNLKPVLKGEDVPPFQVEPFDIIFVPEKIF